MTTNLRVSHLEGADLGPGTPIKWAGGGIGMHAGLKIQWLKNHEGSTPSSPTK